VTDDPQMAIRMLGELEVELLALVKKTLEEKYFSRGEQRFSNWLDKTRQIVIQEISPSKGAQFSFGRTPWPTNDRFPEKPFMDKVRHFSDILIALRESIEQDGFRFIRPVSTPIEPRPASSNPDIAPAKGEGKNMVKPVVFISHITEEAALAALIKNHIQKAFLGMIDVFVSSDGSSIEPGTRWLQGISTNLQIAQAMLVLCSKASVRRPWINFEAGAAWVKEINTVPVCHTDMLRNQLPVPLSELQGIEANKAEQWQGVYSVLAKKLGSDVPPANFTKLVKDIQAFEEEYRKQLAAKAEANAPPPTAIAPPVVSLVGEAREAIEHGRANHALLARRYMAWLIEQLDALNPVLTSDNPDESLIAAIDLTTTLVTDFGRLTEVISATNSWEAATIIYKGFESLLQRYDYDPNNRRSGLSINRHSIDYDFYKFAGHELFVTFFSFFVRDGQWQLIGDLLDESFYIQDHARMSQQTRSFDYANDHIALLEHRNRRLKLNLMTLHGKLLAERHGEGELGRVVPLQQFMDADLFLFFRSNRSDDQSNWDPFSTSNMYNLPRYLVEAVQRRYAERLLKPIGVESIDMLCRRLARRKAQHVRWFDSRMHYDPLEGFDVDKIGTEPT